MPFTLKLKQHALRFAHSYASLSFFIRCFDDQKPYFTYRNGLFYGGRSTRLNELEIERHLCGRHEIFKKVDLTSTIRSDDLLKFFMWATFTEIEILIGRSFSL